MPPRVIANTMELTIKGHMNGMGTTIENVFHYHYTTSPTLEQLTTAVDDWVTNIQSKWLDCQTGIYVLDGYKAKDIGVADGLAYEALAFGSPNGTRTNNIDNSATSAVISWHTSHTGRRFRGRTFVGPVGISDSVRDQVQSAFLTLLTTLATAILETVLAELFTLAVASVPANVSTPITGFTLDNIIGEQRRRKVGVGS